MQKGEDRENVKKFLFSVVIPVYNVEKYLEEAILSIVNQTIGFKKNIQLILINDGSPDNSGDICKNTRHYTPKTLFMLKRRTAEFLPQETRHFNM